MCDGLGQLDSLVLNGQLPFLQGCHIQDIIDDVQQMVAAAANRVEEVGTLAVQLTACKLGAAAMT